MPQSRPMTNAEQVSESFQAEAVSGPTCCLLIERIVYGGKGIKKGYSSNSGGKASGRTSSRGRAYITYGGGKHR